MLSPTHGRKSSSSGGGEYSPRKLSAVSPPIAQTWRSEPRLLLLRGLDFVLLPRLGRFHLGHFCGLHFRVFRPLRRLRLRRPRRGGARRSTGALFLSER